LTNTEDVLKIILNINYIKKENGLMLILAE
jgi:hypothetical protein